MGWYSAIESKPKVWKHQFEVRRWKVKRRVPSWDVAVNKSLSGVGCLILRRTIDTGWPGGPHICVDMGTGVPISIYLFCVPRLASRDQGLELHCVIYAFITWFRKGGVRSVDKALHLASSMVHSWQLYPKDSPHSLLGMHKVKELCTARSEKCKRFKCLRLSRISADTILSPQCECCPARRRTRYTDIRALHNFLLRFASCAQEWCFNLTCANGSHFHSQN